MTESLSNVFANSFSHPTSSLTAPPTVEVVDQFGPHKLEVEKPKFLCQPCTKTELP